MSKAVLDWTDPDWWPGLDGMIELCDGCGGDWTGHCFRPCESWGVVHCHAPHDDRPAR